MRAPALLELERYLHREIPLSQAMGVSVEHVAKDGVRLTMPIEPNLNHRGGLFGGSAAALAILAGWTLVHERLRRDESLDPHLVIFRSRMEYLEPVQGRVTAYALPPSPDAWDRFIRTYRRKGRGRVEVVSELAGARAPAARLVAWYVALERLPGEPSAPQLVPDAPAR